MNKSKFFALCYADIFDYPLTKEELVRWQINERLFDNKSSRLKNYQNKDNYYFLKERSGIIDSRVKKISYSQKKILLAQKIAEKLRLIPFVKLIALTGALSMNNSDRNDDIDFLIIASAKRVWLTRLLTVIFAEGLGLRRRPYEKNYCDKICLNMFLDEEKLNIPKNRQNLYSAHEICQIKPLVNKDKTYEKFLSCNLWVKKYLPNGINIKEEKSAEAGSGTAGLNKYSPAVLLLDLIDYLLFKLQYYYMKPKITREVVERDRIMFHPRDTTKYVEKEFEKRIKKYL